MSEKFEFLSPEWEQAAEKLGQGVNPEAPDGIDVTINVTVTPTPFGDRLISIYNNEGTIAIDKEHRDNADITVKTDYETAYKLFLGGDMNIILSAMLEGRLMVQGDIAKLMSNVTTPGAMPSMPFSQDLAQELLEITAPLKMD